MKIIVFGASRGVGFQVVEQGLQAGHHITAFVRNPEKMQITHPALKIFQGDAMDADAVDRAIAGHEAVISALAPARPLIPHMMETSAKNIVAAMQTHAVRRLISMTGAGVRQPEDEPKFVDHFFRIMLHLLARTVALDSAANVRIITSSNLDWTIVRYPRLTDGARKGTYRVGYVGKDSGMQVSRADAAAFVLRELEEKNWLRKLPVVSY